MIVLSYGMHKSASSFVYQTTRMLIDAHCQETGQKHWGLREVFPQANSDGFVGREFQLLDVIHECQYKVNGITDWLVIKTHHGYCPLVSESARYRGFTGLLMTATFRHPMECALAIVDASKFSEPFKEFDTIEKALHVLRYNVQEFQKWRSVCHTIFYDEIVKNPIDVMTTLSLRLGVDPLPLDEYQAWLSDKKTNISEFNKGILNRHLTEFPQEYRSLFESEFGDFMRYCDQFKS